MMVSIALHNLVSAALSVGPPQIVAAKVLILAAKYGYDTSTDYDTYFSPLGLIIIGLITSTLLFVIYVFYVFPFRSSMPVMAGSALVVLDACSQLDLPMPKQGPNGEKFRHRRDRRKGLRI
jgi:hypothetical protein